MLFGELVEFGIESVQTREGHSIESRFVSGEHLDRIRVEIITEQTIHLFHFPKNGMNGMTDEAWSAGKESSESPVVVMASVPAVAFVMATVASVASVMSLVVFSAAERIEPVHEMLELPLDFSGHSLKGKQWVFVSHQREASEESRLRENVSDQRPMLDSSQSPVDHRVSLSQLPQLILHNFSSQLKQTQYILLGVNRFLPGENLPGLVSHRSQASSENRRRLPEDWECLGQHGRTGDRMLDVYKSET